MYFGMVLKWKQYRSDVRNEFDQYVSELLDNDSVAELDNFIHHYCYTRLKHSLDVAYKSFLLAKLLNWDAKSTARGGLLHDLFFYDWRDEDYVCEGKSHAVEHPKIALENARRLCELNKVEEDIILKHMWFATLVPPRYREGYLVTFVDKYCAGRELLVSIFSRSRLRTVYSQV